MAIDLNFVECEIKPGLGSLKLSVTIIPIRTLINVVLNEQDRPLDCYYNFVQTWQ